MGINIQDAMLNMDRSKEAAANAERLPDPARERLEHHRKRGLKLNGERIALRLAIKEAQTARDENETRYWHTEREAAKHGQATADGDWREPFEKTRTATRRKIEELNTAAMDLPSDHTPAIEEYLGKQPPNRLFTVAEFDMPKLKGNDPFAALPDLQAAADASAAELQRIKIAPLPVEEVQAKIRAYIKKVAKAGTPSLHEMFEGFSVNGRNGNYLPNNPGAHIQFEQFNTNVWVHDDPLLLVDPVKLLAFFFADELEAKLLKLAEKQARAGAVPEAEKPALLAAARQKLVLCQRIEEAVILECEARGAVVPRRCAEPFILLGIEGKPSAA